MMKHFLKMKLFEDNKIVKIPESPRFHRRNPRCTFRALRRQHRPSRGVCSIRRSRLRPGLRQGQRESTGGPAERGCQASGQQPSTSHRLHPRQPARRDRHSGNQVLLIEENASIFKNYAAIRLSLLFYATHYFTPQNSISNCCCMNIDFALQSTINY